MTTRRLLAVSVAGLAALLLSNAYAAFTASMPVPASAVGQTSSSVSPNDLKPPECTMTVTSIASGSGTFSATATYQLVVGSSGNDRITALRNDCVVGGAGSDRVTGVRRGGDECIVSTATQSRNVSNCTIVARRP